MSKYILAYYGGTKPKNPEEGAENMAQWKAWIENLGDAIVNPGTPIGKTNTVNFSGTISEGGDNTMHGFSVVQADNFEAALEMAKTCPQTEGGTIEVSEMMEMH